MYRTHNNGELRLANVNQEVTLCGWVSKRRNFGALVFIDLRDRYGITQLVFNEDIAAQILATSDVAEIKALGRLVLGYDDNWWNGVRQIIVYEGLLAKFSQNVALEKQLKETGKAVLAECAVKDRIWGIGLSMNDPNRFDRDRWQGQNLLGYTLMMVRDSLS